MIIKLLNILILIELITITFCANATCKGYKECAATC